MALALTKHRIKVIFGYPHFCKINEKLVDKQHINKCSCIASYGYDVIDIITDLKAHHIAMGPIINSREYLKQRLTSLRLRNQKLCRD